MRVGIVGYRVAEREGDGAFYYQLLKGQRYTGYGFNPKPLFRGKLGVYVDVLYFPVFLAIFVNDYEFVRAFTGVVNVVQFRVVLRGVLLGIGKRGKSPVPQFADGG